MSMTKPLRDIAHQFDLDHNRLSARELEILAGYRAKNRRPELALHWLQGGLVGVIITSLASLLIPHPWLAFIGVCLGAGILCWLNFLLEKRHG